MGGDPMTSLARKLDRVLVTGAQGFIGTALVSRLRAMGHEVTAADVGAEDAPCDVTDFAQVDAIFRRTVFDTVFHCGAVSGPMVLADQPLAIWQINALGTAHVLEAARLHGAGRIVVCSTANVYGDLTGPVDEDTLPMPTSVYAASKLAAECAVAGYACENGLDSIALRLSWVYGPGRRTPTELEQVLRAALTGGTAAFSEAPDDFTHYLYIDDAVEGLICAGRASALADRVYNITSGAGVTAQHLVNIIADLRPGFRVSLSAPQTAPAGASIIDNRRAEQDMGFSPITDLRAGLKKYLKALAE